MATEVWFRNPHDYIREVVECRQHLIAWDRGVLVKRSIDPARFGDLYFDSTIHYRALVIGDQGAAEVQRGRGMDKPAAVYPVWQYGEDEIDILEDLLAHPVGEDTAACERKDIPADERPVLGQEHRVVVIGIPPVNTGPGRRIMHILSDLQHDYPDAILHIHGLYSFRVMFGQSFRAVDVDARTDAQKGNVILPPGKCIRYEQAVKFTQWINVCGFNPADLSVPRNRCMYNIKSAMWSAEHYKKNFKFKSRGPVEVDPNLPDASVIDPETGKVKSQNLPTLNGDKLLCDKCSLQTTCKYYRVGAVCSVPGEESSSLARFFNTRDSDQIITGLGALLGKQAERLEDGLADEEYGEELDPEVSKQINALFSNGVKLAKLVNPALAGGTKVGVFVNGGSASVGAGSGANQLTAAIVAELEAAGVPRDEITPEMIGRVVAGEQPRAVAAIEAEAS